MRYTLEREQNKTAAISVGVRPAAHNSRTCTASKAPYRACRNLANIHSCSCGGISSMVESCTVTSPRYLDVVLQLSKYQRGRHCANLMHLGLEQKVRNNKPMKTLNPALVLTFLFASELFLTPRAQANLILNGSFESPGISGTSGFGSGRQQYSVPSVALTNWTVAGSGDVFLHKSPDIGNDAGPSFNFAQDGN